MLSTIGKRGYIADYLRRADPNVRTVATGHDPYTPGFASVDRSVLVPSIWDDEYAQAALTVVQEEGVDAVLTFADPDTLALSKLRPQLTDLGVRCFFPPEQVATVCYDKYETYSWAVDHGFSTPETVLEWDLARERFGGSFVAKPRTGSASTGVLFIRPDEGETVLDPDVEYIFQERVDAEEVNLEILGGLDGRPVGLSSWRKIRSRHGETELAVTFRDDRILDYAEQLATAVGMVGPCDVDLMVNDDEIHLIEFNARFGGGYPTSDLAGARFPELLMAMARGESPALEVTFEPDIFMMKRLLPFGGKVSEHGSLLNLTSE